MLYWHYVYNNWQRKCICAANRGVILWPCGQVLKKTSNCMFNYMWVLNRASSRSIRVEPGQLWCFTDPYLRWPLTSLIGKACFWLIGPTSFQGIHPVTVLIWLLIHRHTTLFAFSAPSWVSKLHSWQLCGGCMTRPFIYLKLGIDIFKIYLKILVFPTFKSCN